MIQLMKRLLDFSGKQRKNLIASFIFNLLDSIFEMMPIMAILTVLSGLLLAVEGTSCRFPQSGYPLPLWW